MASGKKFGYEIRQIDAWGNAETGYEYNETWHICNVKSAAADEKRLFRRELRKAGILLIPGKTRCEYDGSVWEIVSRADGCPLFVMIPEY